MKQSNYFFNKFIITMKEFKKTAYHHYGNRLSSVFKFIYYSLFKINTFVIVKFDLSKNIPDYPLDPEFIVVKPTLVELEEYRKGKSLPREFYYDQIHKVKTCYIALCEGELSYIHWIYLKGDYNRFLKLSDDVFELNYNTTLPKFRRRGLMGKMLVYILNDQKRMGSKTAVGVINAQNAPALKNTFAAGFEEVSRIKTFGPFNRKHKI
ncbi:hypothetical protein KQH27_00530 [bacterium]|nr:hypothetical protein [bacterium]